MLQTNIPEHTIINTIGMMSEYTNIPRKCRLVTIDTKKIDNSWKNTMLNSKKDIMELKVSVPAYIYLDGKGNIDFCNGRNRFANLRNAGVKQMPFVIESKDYKRFISSK